MATLLCLGQQAGPATLEESESVRPDSIVQDSDMRNHPDVAEHAQPIAIDRGRIGVLLSHGFTGSPLSMKAWANDLADRGYTVRVPRIPGHGTTWQDLNATTWQDWYREVDATFTELAQHCDHVVVVGLSMGGCLALRLAEQRPDEVAAVVLVNAAIASRDRRLIAAPILKWLVPSLAAVGGDVKDPTANEHAYDRTPLKALHSMMRMWKDVRANLTRITAPVLCFRSEEDHVVDDATITLLKSTLTAPAEYVSLTNSYHVATIDYDAPIIFERTAQFLQEHLGDSQ